MTDHLVVLDQLPTATEFYRSYWNRRPFVVRGAIAADVMGELISGEELAGLAMEEAPQSRMVRTAGAKQNWSCDFGPFAEKDFTKAGEKNWSLLVQHVEQFHPETSVLLRAFSFAPRWLMDDIMVSFSAPGGSVGGHIDSYHVFLVQGEGKRRWKIGREAIEQEHYIEDIPLKVLSEEFIGDDVEVTSGDVIYVPPRFAHEGTTLESALTYSVGFLGPKLSELFSGYAQYLAEFEDLDQRYVGAGLDEGSAGFMLDRSAVDSLRQSFAAPLASEDFTQWLVEFFTASSHEDFGDYSEREEMLYDDEFEGELKDGASLIKPEYVKFAITAAAEGGFALGFDSQSFSLDEKLFPLVQMFMKEELVNSKSYPDLFEHPAYLEFLLELYNHQALEFA
ncbi:cupin domain-containing protein [Kiloniella laminariae]|uniref:Cupin domain-containing protein n=1 Tax=Kiloniella laminariae TaxID=454162 RepID=A0ABT4LJQ9_9PROT|nr:cupin domain-containing protein [Kiloniella laminariae]MCZ4281338.1 cupin domain-containing protein [Kiloniella laminariae]